jgi:hypothetical protein
MGVDLCACLRGAVAYVCVPQVFNVTGQRGVLAIGGGVLDIDTLVVHSTALSPAVRSRGWFDRSSDALRLAVAFGTNVDCGCGNATLLNRATSSDAKANGGSGLQLLDVPCDEALCERAPLVSVPWLGDGVWSRLRSPLSNLAVRSIVSLCNASVIVDPTQPPLPSAAHHYRVRGTGLFVTASTCRVPNADTRLYVIRASDCDMPSGAVCVAANDNALRDPSSCPGGGSEVTWRAERNVDYVVVVLAPFISLFPRSAVRTFTLELTDCIEPKCAALGSCMACSHLDQDRVGARAYGITMQASEVSNATLLIEARCVGGDCSASSTVAARVPVHASLTAPLPISSTGTIVFERAESTRLSLRIVAVEPAVYAEPAFGAAFGNDNVSFLTAYGSLAASVLRDFCSNPLPLRYAIELGGQLAPQTLETNTTCEALSNSTQPTTLEVQNTLCNDTLYHVARVRCSAKALPDLAPAERAALLARGVEPTVCRSDDTLPVIAAILDGAASDVERRALQKAVGEAAALASQVDCNAPPVELASNNCSQVALANASSLLRDALRARNLDAAASAQQQTAALARCEASQREIELRDKAKRVFNRGHCQSCSTGGGIVVNLKPQWHTAVASAVQFGGDRALLPPVCMLQQRAPTLLLAYTTLTVDGETVLNDTLLPITSLGLLDRMGLVRVRFSSGPVDPVVDVLLRQSAASLEMAAAPADWVPFADGNSVQWGNDSCTRVPIALQNRAPALVWSASRASSWSRLTASQAATYRDSLRRASAFGASLSARVGAAVPAEFDAVWLHQAEGDAVARTAVLSFGLAGSLLEAIAPAGTIDESSIAAHISLDDDVVPNVDRIRISLNGTLFNVFNGTGEQYFFEVSLFTQAGEHLARFDLLQRGGSRFETAITVKLPRTAANLHSTGSERLALYSGLFVVEFRDATSRFAVVPSANRTVLNLYAAEQALRMAELDERLWPIVILIAVAVGIGVAMVIGGMVLQRWRPIDDDRLHRRHVGVIAVYVAFRVARSIVLTTTVFLILMEFVLSEQLRTIKQLPQWVDSISNRSTQIAADADAALSLELERQEALVLEERSLCAALLAQRTESARADRARIASEHTRQKALRNLEGLQTELALREQQALVDAANADLDAERAQTYCWKRFTMSLANATLDFEATINARITADFDARLAELRAVTLGKLDAFNIKFDKYRLQVEAMHLKAVDLHASFSVLTGTLRDLDPLNVFKIPVAGPAFDLPGAPSLPHVNWTVQPLGIPDFQLPRCPCDGAPDEKARIVPNVSQAVQRNYTALIGDDDVADDAVPPVQAVPVPKLSLRSFIQAPVLIDLFAFIPPFDSFRAILVIIDILIIIYTHVKTVQVVVTMARGVRDDDEILAEDPKQRGDGGPTCPRLSACCLRCVDVCAVFLERHRTWAVQLVLLGGNAILALCVVGALVAGVFFIAQVASSMLTIQALDGVGIIVAIGAPVTGALGSANVKAMDNARQINQQTLVEARNTHRSALREVAVVTNDFNADQAADLRDFNERYCDVQLRLHASDPRYVCDDGVEQTVARFDADQCPHFVAIVPRLYARVDRLEFRTLVISTLEPYVVAFRALVLNFIWFVCGVICALVVLLLLGQVLFKALALVHMIRTRQRLVFESRGALTSTYTTRKTIPAVARVAEPVEWKDAESFAQRGRSRRSRRVSSRRKGLTAMSVTPLAPSNAPLTNSPLVPLRSRRRSQSTSELSSRANTQQPMLSSPPPPPPPATLSGAPARPFINTQLLLHR